MSVAPLSASDINSCKPVESSLSVQEIVKRVQAINAEHIESMAKTIIHKIMDCLNIDVSPKKFTGKDLLDANGNVIGHEAIIEKHKATVDRSQFMAAMLPLVIAQITSSFSAPIDVVNSGIRLNIIGQDGLIHQMITKKREYADYLNAISSKFLNGASWQMKRKVLNYSVHLHVGVVGNTSELYFAMTDSIGSHVGCTLADFKEMAAKYTVRE